MQVYVPSNAISTTANTFIIATYGDDIALPEDAHPDSARFVFPSSKHVVMIQYIQYLTPSWRDDLVPVINNEANYRILKVFPDYQQRNANQYVQAAMLRSGSDPAQWPPEDQAIKTEADRGWAYVSAVRAASNSLAVSNPLNPCDDSHWPAEIAPIKFE